MHRREPRRGTLIELAPELLDLVLSFLRPQDLVSFGRTCSRAGAFIRPSNQLLWRSAFLHLFDDPKHAWALLLPTARAENRHREATWDWFCQVRRRMKAFHAVGDTASASMLADPEPIVTALLDILETASYSDRAGGHPRASLNLEFLRRLFQVAPNPEKIVHDYHRDIDSVSLPLDVKTATDRPITRSMLGRRNLIPQWASKLHIFYGMTEREDESVQARASARALVYDWAVTGPGADYGPFFKDKSGAVNWQTLEAITSLMHRIFGTIRKAHLLGTPSGFEHNIPQLLPLNPVHPEDWAGVTRSWVGTYAFLDYRALVHYNFANHLEYYMDLGACEEACGDLMRLELDVDDSKELQRDFRLQSDLPYCKDLPKLFFSGRSSGRPTGRPHIHVRGCVFLAPGARQVRWRFIINYARTDQWQLEGVQPAGVRSGGIYGLWSHVDHDENGPMGPFCYFPLEFCEPA